MREDGSERDGAVDLIEFRLVSITPQAMSTTRYHIPEGSPYATTSYHQEMDHRRAYPSFPSFLALFFFLFSSFFFLLPLLLFLLFSLLLCVSLSPISFQCLLAKALETAIPSIPSIPPPKSHLALPEAKKAGGEKKSPPLALLFRIEISARRIPLKPQSSCQFTPDLVIVGRVHPKMGDGKGQRRLDAAIKSYRVINPQEEKKEESDCWQPPPPSLFP